MPPVPVPVVRFLAAVVVVDVVLRCFKPDPPEPPDLAEAILGGELPTDVELAGVG